MPFLMSISQYHTCILWLIFSPTKVIILDCIVSLMMLKILHLLSEKNIWE